MSKWCLCTVLFPSKNNEKKNKKKQILKFGAAILINKSICSFPLKCYLFISSSMVCILQNTRHDVCYEEATIVKEEQTQTKTHRLRAKTWSSTGIFFKIYNICLLGYFQIFQELLVLRNELEKRKQENILVHKEKEVFPCIKLRGEMEELTELTGCGI